MKFRQFSPNQISTIFTDKFILNTSADQLRLRISEIRIAQKSLSALSFTFLFVQFVCSNQTYKISPNNTEVNAVTAEIPHLHQYGFDCVIHIQLKRI